MEEGEVTTQTLGRKLGRRNQELFIFVVLILFLLNILLIIIKASVFFLLFSIVQISSLIFITQLK